MDVVGIPEPTRLIRQAGLGPSIPRAKALLVPQTSRIHGSALDQSKMRKRPDWSGATAQRKQRIASRPPTRARLRALTPTVGTLYLHIYNSPTRSRVVHGSTVKCDAAHTLKNGFSRSRVHHFDVFSAWLLCLDGGRPCPTRRMGWLLGRSDRALPSHAARAGA
jgi:hypothetical protein